MIGIHSLEEKLEFISLNISRISILVEYVYCLLKRSFSVPLTYWLHAIWTKNSDGFPRRFKVIHLQDHPVGTLKFAPRARHWTLSIMSGLIEGLPDAVVLRCLARVPFHHHPMLELVSRSWRAAIRSTEIFKVRQEVGSMEDFLCVCTYDPENLWQLYDPLQDLWITLPILPSRIRHLAHFGVVSTAGKLFVLGGGSDAVDPLTGDQDGSFATNEVWSYDPIARQWSPHASMRVPRSMFACCVLNGKVIVAGGFTSCRKSISQAELYDPDKDVLIPLPDLQRTHNSPCSGILLDGKVHVVHKGLPRVQVWDHSAHKWMVKDYSWDQGPMTMLQGSIYVMCHGNIFKQERYSRRFIVSASEFRKRIGFGMFGLGDEIYIVGGVIGPDRWNWDVKPLSDVDVDRSPR